MRAAAWSAGLMVGAVACRSPGPDLGAPFGLAGEGVLGLVRTAPGGCGGGGLEVGLWGPGWGTDGFVPAESNLEEGISWLYFPLQTGLGEGDAALRLQGETAILPLGAREGELEVALGRGKVPSAAALAEAEARGRSALEAERAAWRDGRFRLMDGDTLVGDLRWEGERVTVAVYDATWLTPVPVETTAVPDGADLVLSFAVEPTISGETAQIRVSVPARTVVVPASEEPTELDRRLRLEPGVVTDEARAAAMASAEAASDAMEASRVVPLAMALAAVARAPDGRCKRVAELGPDWELLLPGYDVAIGRDTGSQGEGGCAVEISPIVRQHGRRFRGRVNQSGLIR